MSERFHAKGVITKLGDADLAGTPTYTSVPGTTGAPWPNRQNPRLDATAHDSPGFAREYRNNLTDFPQVTMPIFWDPNDPVHIDILAIQVTQEVRAWKVFTPPIVSPAFVATFEAQVAEFGPAFPVDGLMTATVTLQVTSDPSYGAT